MKKLLFSLVLLGQFLGSGPANTGADITEGLNVLRRQSIKAAHFDLKKPSVLEGSPEIFNVHGIERSKDGVFHFTVDQSLFQEDLLLYLIYNQRSVGALSYKDNILEFMGFAKHHFQIEGLKIGSLAAEREREGPEESTPLAGFYAQAGGTLTIKGENFADTASFKGSEVSLEGLQKYAKGLVVHDCEKCTLSGDITAPATSIKAKRFLHQGTLHCDDAFLDFEQGEDTEDSDIQASHDIVFKGFRDYMHRGLLRAKRSIIREGDNFQNCANSNTFAGLLNSFQGQKFQEDGRTVAWQSRIDAGTIVFDKEYKFLGRYLIANTEGILSKISVLEGADIKAAFAVCMESKNRLIHDGKISIDPELFHLPVWEYSSGPKHSEQSVQATALLENEIASYRREFLENFKSFAGVYLKAAGTLKGYGAVYTDCTSVIWQGMKVYFSGHSQSGFLESNQTIVSATKAFCDSRIKSPTLLLLNISDSLTVPGYLEGRQVVICGCENESGRTCSVNITGTINALEHGMLLAKKTELSGKVIGNNWLIDSPVTKITEAGEVSVGRQVIVDAQEDFDNRGKVRSEGEAHLKLKVNPDFGDVETTGAFIVEVPRLEDTAGKLAGDYPNYNKCGSLHIITQETTAINRPIDTNRGVGLTAPEVTVNEPVRSREGPVNFYAPGGKCEVNALITAGKWASVIANEVQIERKVKRTSIPGGYEERLGNKVGIHAKDGDVLVSGQQQLRTKGAELKARGGHVYTSSPDSYLGSQQTETDVTKSGKRSSQHHHSVTHHKTILDGELGVRSISMASKLHPGLPSLILEGVDSCSSKGAIHAYSEGTLLGQAVYDIHEEDNRSSSKGGLFKKTQHTRVQKASVTANPNKHKALEGVALESEGNNHQCAPEIETDGFSRIKSHQGRTFMHAAQSHSFKSTERKKKSIVWQSQRQIGSVNDVGDIASILAKEGIEISGAQGVEVDIIGKTLDKALQKHLQSSETEWVNGLQNRSGTEWKLVSEKHKQWRQKTGGLTRAVSAVVAIAVSCLTAGAGEFFIAPAIASMEIGGTAAATTLTASANATFSSLSSTAAVSLLSNKGNVGAVLKDLSSSKSLRSLATSIVVAGTVSGACHGFDIPTASATVSQSVPDRIQEALVRAGTETVANTTIERKANLGKSLVQALCTGAANVAGGSLANKVGLEYKAPDSSLDYVSHKILHAAIGAGMGVLSNNDALSGAIGATVGEIVGEAYGDAHDSFDLDPNSSKHFEKVVEDGTTLAQVSAATVAALLNQDPNTASKTAHNAVQENALHKILDGCILVYDLTCLGYGLVTGDEDQVKEALVELAMDAVGMASPVGNIRGYARLVKAGSKLAMKAKPVGKLLGDTGKKIISSVKRTNPPVKVVQEVSKRQSREQPWTIRSGQEYKERIVGRAQRTGTPGHATRSTREAIAAAKRKDVVEVYMDRGYKRATGEHLNPNRRPDVLIKKKDGTMHVVEVRSRSDDPKKLLKRNEEALAQLPKAKQGKIRIVEITRTKK